MTERGAREVLYERAGAGTGLRGWAASQAGRAGRLWLIRPQSSMKHGSGLGRGLLREGRMAGARFADGSAGAGIDMGGDQESVSADVGPSSVSW